MGFSLAPVLADLRAIYAIPLGTPRFDAYLAAMKGPDGELTAPLTAANPMAKPETIAVLDRLIAIDAERVARDALARAEERLPREAADHALVVHLVLADDLGGGWTHRAFADSAHRFPANTYALRRNWAPALLFSADEPTPDAVTAAVLAAVRRTLFQLRFGLPETLNDRLRQEGVVLRFEGARPWLAPDVVATAAATLAPLRASTAEPVRFAAMYGDDTARECGHAPLGLPAYAGFAVALAEATASPDGEA